MSSTSVLSSAREEVPTNNYQLQSSVGLPGVTQHPYAHHITVPGSSLSLNRLNMAAQTIPGQVKLELAQHPGMFPQAYIIPNGHPGTEYVQAQQVAAGQVVGPATQVIPPPVRNFT